MMCPARTDTFEYIRATVAAARGRLVVIACGGLDQTNIAQVLRETGAPEGHFAALRDEPSGMRFRNPHVGRGERPEQFPDLPGPPDGQAC